MPGISTESIIYYEIFIYSISSFTPNVGMLIKQFECIAGDMRLM